MNTDAVLLDRPDPIGRWTSGVFLAYLVVCLAAIASGMLDLELLSRISTGNFSEEEATRSEVRAGIISLTRLVFSLATIVLFLVWFHSVHRNLPSLGNRSLEFTPGWAVGWFFIPLANLVRPFQVMREVWEGSDPGRIETEEHSSNQIISYSSGASGLVIWWWVLFLLSNVVGNITAILSTDQEPSISDLQISTAGNVIWNFLVSVSILVTVRLIDRITKWQYQRAQQIRQNLTVEPHDQTNHDATRGETHEQS